MIQPDHASLLPSSLKTAAKQVASRHRNNNNNKNVHYPERLNYYYSSLQLLKRNHLYYATPWDLPL